MKIICITQARMGSTRLPGKVLKAIDDIPLLEYHFKRISLSKFIHQHWLSTSNKPEDQALFDYAIHTNKTVFRGSEHNVLERFYLTAKEANAQKGDLILRLTGDCPLVCPTIVDYAIEQHLKYNKQGYTHCDKNFIPRGFDVEIFPFEALESAQKEANDDASFEHVTYYLYKHTDIKLLPVQIGKMGWGDYRLCVDEPLDFQLIEALLKELRMQELDWLTVSAEMICKLLDKRPEIALINQEVIQKTPH